MSNPSSNYTPHFSEDAKDDTFDKAPSNITEGSGLDRLQQLLQEEVKLDRYSHTVPARKSLRLILDPNIDGEQFQRWQRNAIIGKARGAESQVDSVKLAAVVIANCTVGVEVRNQNGDYTEVRDSNGLPMDFKNPEFRQMLIGDNPVSGGAQLVRKLFGNDGHLLECSRVLIERAGYGDEEDEGDDPLE